MPTNQTAFEPFYVQCRALASLGVPPHQILAGIAAVGARFANDIGMAPEWRAVLDVALASADQQLRRDQRGNP